jgi:FAD:protein FMN transferase
MEPPATKQPAGHRISGVQLARQAMGCQFRVYIPGHPAGIMDAGCAALDGVERLETRLSVFRPESEISLVNREAHRRAIPVDSSVFQLLRAAERLSAATNGAFDVAAGALVRVWGFQGGSGGPPSESSLAAATAASGMRQVVLDPVNRTVRLRRSTAALNLGSIGKGFAVDRALEICRNRFHIGSLLIEGGYSSVRALGSGDGWRVALADPLRPSRTLAHIVLRNRAVGTSANTNQLHEADGKQWGHLIDPRTGRPADGLAGASAIAPTATRADALATAFFVMGEHATREFCRRHPDVTAILVTKPGPDRRARILVIGDRHREVEIRQNEPNHEDTPRPPAHCDRMALSL